MRRRGLVLAIVPLFVMPVVARAAGVGDRNRGHGGEGPSPFFECLEHHPELAPEELRRTCEHANETAARSSSHPGASSRVAEVRRPIGHSSDASIEQLALRLGAIVFTLGLVVAGFAQLVGYLVRRQAAASADPPGLDQGVMPGDEARRRSLSELRERDPGFREEVLLERAWRILVAVEEARSRDRLEPVRALMTDAAWQELRTRRDLARVFGTRPVAVDFAREGAWLSALELAGEYDAAHVGFRYEERRADVSGEVTDERALDAARGGEPTLRTEVWSFLRRGRARTVLAGVIEGACPNCGAPFAGGESGRCDHCLAVVNSGAYDWVLAKVSTVDSFWVTGSEAPGLGALQRVDPDCAAQLVEDRAALVFWRMIDALANEDERRVRKVALPGFVDDLAQRFERDRADGVREWLRNVEVEGVDLVEIERRPNTDDVARVRVRWRRQRVVAARDVPQDAKWVEKASIVELTRRRDARTDTVCGLGTFRCWSCQAPLGDSDSTTCEFCGRDQIDDGSHWRLAALESWDAFRARQAPDDERAVDDPPAPIERQRLFRIAVALAASDYTIGAEERRALDQLAFKLGLAPTFVRECLDDPELARDDLAESRHRTVFLSSLAAVAAADGKVEPEERALLERAGRALDLTSDDWDRALAAALAKRPPKRMASGS